MDTPVSFSPGNGILKKFFQYGGQPDVLGKDQQPVVSSVHAVRCASAHLSADAEKFLRQLAFEKNKACVVFFHLKTKVSLDPDDRHGQARIFRGSDFCGPVRPREQPAPPFFGADGLMMITQRGAHAVQIAA